MRTQTVARKMVRRGELLTILIVTTASTAFCIWYDGFEAFKVFVDANEPWQLDELFITFIFGGIASLILFFRRARDLISKSSDGKPRNSRHQACPPRSVDWLPTVACWPRSLRRAHFRSGRSTECASFIDLDHFKPVTMSRDVAGDAALIEVAARITSIVGEAGTVHEWVDEFACVSPAIEQRAFRPRMASQIQRALKEPYCCPACRCSSAPRSALLARPTMGLPPAACSTAPISQCTKKKGSRVVYPLLRPGNDIPLRARASLEEDLSWRVRAGEIRPHFQPVMDLATDSILGFEALARWTHPMRGLIPPDTFIPLPRTSASSTRSLTRCSRLLRCGERLAAQSLAFRQYLSSSAQGAVARGSPLAIVRRPDSHRAASSSRSLKMR